MGRPRRSTANYGPRSQPPFSEPTNRPGRNTNTIPQSASLSSSGRPAVTDLRGTHTPSLPPSSSAATFPSIPTLNLTSRQVASAPGLLLSEDDSMVGGTPRRKGIEAFSEGRAQSSTRATMETPRPEEAERRYSFGGMATPRGNDAMENERQELNHPMPVFGSASSLSRPAREIFPGTLFTAQQATGGTQHNPWLVSDERRPATARPPATLFSNERPSGHSTYCPIRSSSNVSPPRPQPYAFLPQSSAINSPFVNESVNLIHRSPREPRSASHSATTAVQSSATHDPYTPINRMTELQAAIRHAQQNAAAPQSVPHLSPDPTSNFLYPNSNLTSQQQNTTHPERAQTEETFKPLTAEENKGLTRATTACKGDLSIFDPLDECCLDAHVAELSSVLSSVGLDESNTKYLLARTGSKEVQRIVKELGPLHQRAATEVVNHVACKLFPRSNHYLVLQRWLMTPAPLTSTRAALRLVTLTLERLETLRVRRQLGALPPDSEKSQWLFNKLPVIAQNAIYQNMEGWTYEQLVQKIERGILPSEETACATLSEWETKLTACKPPRHSGPPLVFATQQLEEAAPEEPAEFYSSTLPIAFTVLPPLPVQQQQQLAPAAYHGRSSGWQQPQQQQQCSSGFVPRQDSFNRAGAPEKWQQQQQQRKAGWQEKPQWLSAPPAWVARNQPQTQSSSFTTELGETYPQCSRCHFNHVSRCYRCRNCPPPTCTCQPPKHLLCTRCALVGHSSDRCYATVHDQSTPHGAVRIVVSHNPRTGGQNVRVHQHSQQPGVDWARFVDSQAAIAENERELARKGLTPNTRNAPTPTPATATPPNTLPIGSPPTLLPLPVTQVTQATTSPPRLTRL
eukprot:GHVU01034566.1.p1 GENE.GHVU01034566.1~~GHVU01034566.1.p1  ORF type:complete len:854 (-),score=80.84 GHVU01034566.1:109-2670(-)